MDFKEIEILVANAKVNDQLSKEKLIQEFKPFIINLSNRTFIHGYDSQDVQNECFRILFKCISIYDLSKHRFVAYATNGIKNSINDLIRKSKNRSATDGYEALTLCDDLEKGLISGDFNLEELLCSKSQYEALKEAFNNLTKEERELITFVYLKNNSLVNYAYWKNMCYSTANRKKRLILNKMKSYLEFQY